MKLKKKRERTTTGNEKERTKYRPTTEHKEKQQEKATKRNVIYFTICTIWKMNKTFIQLAFFHSLSLYPSLSNNCLRSVHSHTAHPACYLQPACFVSKIFIPFLFWDFLPFFLYFFSYLMHVSELSVCMGYMNVVGSRFVSILFLYNMDTYTIFY